MELVVLVALYLVLCIAIIEATAYKLQEFLDEMTGYVTPRDVHIELLSRS